VKARRSLLVSFLCHPLGVVTNNMELKGPVRSILGVAESDRVPKEELVETTYVIRTTIGDNIRYTAVKRIRHTQESFLMAPLVFKPYGDDFDPVPLRYNNGQMYELIGSLRPFTMLFLYTGMTLTFTAALTSFLLLPVTSGWSWSRIFASFGLFAPLSFSSVMWAYVYIKQQIPERTNSRWVDVDRFAVAHTVKGNEPAVLCNLYAMSERQERMCRACSLIAGALIAFG